MKPGRGTKPKGAATREASDSAHSTQDALARLRPAGGWPPGTMSIADISSNRALGMIAAWLEGQHRAAVQPGTAYEAGRPDSYRWAVATDAMSLCTNLQTHDQSPRLKQERRRVTAIQRHALALHKLLRELDAAAPGFLANAGLGGVAPQIEAQDAADLSQWYPAGFKLPYDRVGALRTLVIATTFNRPVLPLLAEMVAAYGGYLARGPKQGGSSGRLEQRKRGDPRLVFARNCVTRLMGLLGADAVKGTEGGTADAYMRNVWTFATGVHPDGANLFHFLIQALPARELRGS